MINAQQIKLEMDDGTVTILTFCTQGRSPTLPEGATWNGDGSWSRPATDENIWAELRKAFPGRNAAGIRRAVPLAFHRIDKGETLPADRKFRNAWRIDLQGVVTEDLETARQITRDKIQVAVTRDLVEVNSQYVAATMAKDTVEADRLALVRETLEAKVTDPQIDAATTVNELRALLP